MELPIYIAGFVAFVLLLKFLEAKIPKSKERTIEKTAFRYSPKASIMTPAENKFFDTLRLAFEDNYYIFPQMHLSSLLDHKIKGQSWKHAITSINQKSVDYVICDRISRQPLAAIELDDWSHDREDRVTRDTKVEQLLKDSNIPLIRFKDVKDLSLQEISQKVKSALREI